MWNEVKQQQLNELQQREAEDSLTVKENQTLEKLLSELEREEWETLNPALERLREEENGLQTEISRADTRNAVLAALTSRQNDLVARAETQLKNLRNEHEALKFERECVLHDLAA